jgi:hypothetical protein
MHNKKNKDTKNDLNQGAKIFSHFKIDPDFRFYYIIVNFEFTGKKGTVMTFTKEQPTILYAPWVKDVYVNPANGHLQSYYAKKHFSPRSVKSFLKKLEKELKRDPDSKKQLEQAKKKIKKDKNPPESHKLWLKKEYVQELDQMLERLNMQ